MEKCSRLVASEIAKKLQHYGQNNIDEQKPPVIFNVFSNGGGLVVESLEILVERAQSRMNDKSHEENDRDLLLVGDNLKGQLFDSAPAFVTPTTGLRAIDGAFRNAFLKAGVQFVFLLYAGGSYAYAKLLGAPDPAQVYWMHMLNSTICRKQGFVYSQADRMTSAERLEELIQHRKQDTANTILELKFDDSDHVLHFRKYPEEYLAFVDRFLEMVVGST